MPFQAARKMTQGTPAGGARDARDHGWSRCASSYVGSRLCNPCLGRSRRSRWLDARNATSTVFQLDRRAAKSFWTIHGSIARGPGPVEPRLTMFSSRTGSCCTHDSSGRAMSIARTAHWELARLARNPVSASMDPMVASACAVPDVWNADRRVGSGIARLV